LNVKIISLYYFPILIIKKTQSNGSLKFTGLKYLTGVKYYRRFTIEILFVIAIREVTVWSTCADGSILKA